ncbi:MAG: magnesium transporter [Planctomycetota bacterium]|jgi:magnesium transporter
MQWHKIFVPEITELIEQRNLKELGEFLRRLHPADIVDILRDLPSADRVLAFRVLDKAKLAWVFSLFEPEEQEELLKLFTEQKVKEILLEMDSDDRAQLLEELPADVVKKFLALLPQDEKEITNLILNYPDDSAGRLITTDYVALRADRTATEAIEYVRKTGPDKETIYICYVIDQTRKLIGVLSLRDLILAPPDKKVGDIMKTIVSSVKTTDDKELAARVIQKYDLLAVPVVDQEGRLVGIVTVDDVIDILEEEATEDMEKMAAVRLPEEEYFKAGFLQVVRKRATWLVILIIAETFTSDLIENYTTSLTSLVALAYFIPMLTSSGGNTGAQSSTLVIRALAIGEVTLGEWWKILRREIWIGATLGGILGGVAYLKVYHSVGDQTTGIAVGLALLAVVMVGNIIGAVIPLIFRRLGWDPATVSSPLIATVLDLTGLLIYFEVTRRMLSI